MKTHSTSRMSHIHTSTALVSFPMCGSALAQTGGGTEGTLVNTATAFSFGNTTSTEGTIYVPYLVPNTAYNRNNTSAFGRFTGVVGDFSNFGTAQANVQMSIRAEF